MIDLTLNKTLQQVPLTFTYNGDTVPLVIQKTINSVVLEVGTVSVSEGMLSANYTAGEDLVNGELCYMDSGGTIFKANASTVATSQGMLVIATSNVLTGATGSFLLWGIYNTTGLTVGNRYHLSTTSGAIQTAENTVTDSVTRCIGFAITTTKLMFNPSNDFIINN